MVIFKKHFFKEKSLDAPSFHWIQKEDPNQIEGLHFTRRMFGLSSFVLKGSIGEHPSSYTKKCSAEVAEMRDDLYVHDLIDTARKDTAI